MTTEQDAAAKKRLRLRRRHKKSKPNFVRPESWRYVRLKQNWRKPKGLDHKVRLQYNGWPPGASVGYRGPKISRGLHPSGYRQILVHNAEELKKLDPKAEVALIAHTVGKRKRATILSEARKKRITVLNLKLTKEAAPEEKELTEEEKLEEKEIEKELEEEKKPKQKLSRAKKPEEETKNQ